MDDHRVIYGHIRISSQLWDELEKMKRYAYYQVVFPDRDVIDTTCRDDAPKEIESGL